MPDELERVIERQVAEGRADSPAAFVEGAVRRLVDETRAEEEDGQLLRERLMARLRGRLVADG